MIGRRRPWPRAVACVFSVSLFSLSFDLQETKKKKPIIQVLFNLPLYFQAVKLESATQAGGRLLVPSLAGTFAGVSTGFIISRTGRLFDTLALGNCLLVIGAIMWRSLGAVFGVAMSSPIVQNGLLVFLERTVTGPDKRAVIERVRREVQAVFKLDPIHQRQGLSLSLSPILFSN